MKRLLTALLAGMAASVSIAGAAEAAYPERPITMIVPFAAGGPTDAIARIVGEHMSKVLGQTVIIENVTGAGGTTGITRGMQAAADGYTIMMGHMGTHGAAPALYPTLKYDPAKDFQPIGLAAGTPILIVTKKDFAANSIGPVSPRKASRRAPQAISRSAASLPPRRLSVPTTQWRWPSWWLPQTTIAR